MIGRPMNLDHNHDGRLIADIVAEWAKLHGEPFDLHLSGTAGGTFSRGEGGEHVEMDALDFIRTLSDDFPAPARCATRCLFRITHQLKLSMERTHQDQHRCPGL